MIDQVGLGYFGSSPKVQEDSFLALLTRFGLVSKAGSDRASLTGRIDSK